MLKHQTNSIFSERDSPEVLEHEANSISSERDTSEVSYDTSHDR